MQAMSPFGQGQSRATALGVDGSPLGLQGAALSPGYAMGLAPDASGVLCNSCLHHCSFCMRLGSSHDLLMVFYASVASWLCEWAAVKLYRASYNIIQYHIHSHLLQRLMAQVGMMLIWVTIVYTTKRTGSHLICFQVHSKSCTT